MFQATSNKDVKDLFDSIQAVMAHLEQTEPFFSEVDLPTLIPQENLEGLSLSQAQLGFLRDVVTTCTIFLRDKKRKAPESLQQTVLVLHGWCGVD